MAEKRYKCVSIYAPNPGSDTGSIQIQSPSGKTLGFYIQRPPVTEIEGEYKIEFSDIVSKCRLAHQERQKWHHEHFNLHMTDSEKASFAASEAQRYPAGMSTAYIYLTRQQMQFLVELHEMKNGKRELNNFEYETE